MRQGSNYPSIQLFEPSNIKIHSITYFNESLSTNIVNYVSLSLRGLGVIVKLSFWA